MRNSVFLAIGVRLTRNDDEAIDVSDLEPILMSTEALLEKAALDGIHIRPGSVRKNIHSLTLASIEGVLVFLRCKSEETGDLDETRYLVRERRAELARAFTSIMTSPTPPSHSLEDSKSIKALFILATAFQAAQNFTLYGTNSKRCSPYNVETTYLRVEEKENVLHFDVVTPASMNCGTSETVH